MSDTKSKLRKGQNIERNWQCDVQNTVPADIRPRAGPGRGKVLVGSVVPEARWHDWSLGMLTELERLSSMTTRKLAFAQELMLLEVSQRQQSLSARNQNVVEILVSDLERINQDLAQSRLGGTASEGIDDGDQDDDDDDDDEDEPDKTEADGEAGADEAEDLHLGDNRMSQSAVPENDPSQLYDTEIRSDQQEIKAEESETDATMRFTEEPKEAIPRSQSVRSNGISKPSNHAKVIAQNTRLKKELKDKVKIANLFAEAMRLKQEAAKREAEAYELEAKMLVAEAKQLEWTEALMLPTHAAKR